MVRKRIEHALSLVALRAGCDNGGSLVVMSKGTKWTQQSYKVDEFFPYDWIRKKWREGFHVTSLATCGGRPQQWAVVMSRDCGYARRTPILLCSFLGLACLAM